MDGSEHHAPISGRALVLFVALSVIWGIPYLFIKVAVAELNPVALAGGRTLLASLVLLPLAAGTGALRPALRAWPWVAAFGLLEMAGPWVLLGHAETRVSSGFAGLMIATVPIVGVLLAGLRGEPHAFARVRLLGLSVGILGVACLVGIDSVSGHLDLVSVAELLLVAVGYAVAPLIASTRLAAVPSLGSIALAVSGVAVLFLPATIAGFSHGLPSPRVTASVVVLGLVCTALAFVVFFELIAAVGAIRATIVTFLNPAVAVLLGMAVLGEPLTAGIAIGFPLVLAGAWWATRPLAHAG